MGGFLGSSAVKNLPAMQETRVQSLGREHTLEKEMAIHSSILAWEIPWTEEPGKPQSRGLQKSWTRLMTIAAVKTGDGETELMTKGCGGWGERWWSECSTINDR